MWVQLSSGCVASWQRGHAVHKRGYLVLTALPFGFLIGLLRVHLRRGAVGNLVVELGGPAGPQAGLRQALARVLGDPSLQILYRVPGAGSGEFVDDAGHPAALPGADAGRAGTGLDRDGTPVAPLVHGPAPGRQA